MLTFVYAQDAKGGIGYKGQLPWRLKQEMAHFKQTTINHQVIMGRTTFDSLGGKPLPKRDNIVVSRTLDPEAYADVSNLRIVSSIEEALDIAAEDAYVIGGKRLYESLYPYATHIIRTVIHHTYETDVQMPDIDEAKWQLTRTEEDSDQETGVSFVIEYWEKKGTSI